MALNKRILDKIEKRCKGDDAMLDYLRRVIAFELTGAKQYTKEYQAALKECARKGIM